jgi:hypothetical protein
MTHSDLAEIRVLQDPSNITTGVPSSCPLNWSDRHIPFHVQREAAVARSELPNLGSQQIDVQSNPPTPPHLLVGDHDDTFERRWPDLTCDRPPRHEESNIVLIYEHSRHGPTPPGTGCDDPFQDSHSLVKLSRHAAAASNSVTYGTTDRRILECKVTTTCHDPQISSYVASQVTPPAQTDAVALRKDLPDDAIDVLQLPSPVLALSIPSSQRSSVCEHAVHETSKNIPSESEKAPVDTEVTRAQQKYRDSLAGLEEVLDLEKLDSEVTRHVEQNPFVGAPGTPAPSSRSRNRSPSESVDVHVHPSPSDGNFDAIEIPTRTRRTAEHISESKENRRDSLVGDTKYEIVHQHGPPSPERSVRLPLRPKAPMKQCSFESTLFKPILDRVAAKHLGVFRPGSDPSLRQKYFPHSTVSTSSPVRYPRQPSLDLDTESDDTESCEDLALFERAVEKPSPLHIRKQSNNTPVHAVSSPQTPASASTLQAPGSSPIRTPSMGDRRQFDVQRAERDARYNAILSGNSPSTVVKNSTDIQLAEFGNAGPGSKGSTPTRSSGGIRGQRRMSPTYLQRMIGQDPKWSSPFMALSRD